MKKITKFVFIILIIFPIFSGGFCFGQNSAPRPLEVDYINIGWLNIGPGTTFPEYVRYMFYFAIFISGFIALASFTIAGFQYITSAGEPQKIKDAKDRITSAIVGTVILLTSVILLNTINTQFIVPDLPKTNVFGFQIPSGVWLCDNAVDMEKTWKIGRYLTEPELSANLSDEAKRKLKEEQSVLINNIVTHCANITTRKSNMHGDPSKYWNVWIIPTELSPEWGGDTKGTPMFDELTKKTKYYEDYGLQLLINKEYVSEKRWEERWELIFRDPKQNRNTIAGPYWKSIRGANRVTILGASPFQILYQPEPDFSITFFEKENENKDFGECEGEAKCNRVDFSSANPPWYKGPIDIGFPVSSMKMEGNPYIIVLLSCPDVPERKIPITDSLKTYKINLFLYRYGRCWEGWWWGKCEKPCADKAEIMSAMWL